MLVQGGQCSPEMTNVAFVGPAGSSEYSGEVNVQHKAIVVNATTSTSAWHLSK